MEKKFDITKPVQTRNGLKVRILCTDRAGDFPVVGLVKDGQTESTQSWRLNGRFTTSNVVDHSWDLVNVPVRIQRTVWLNIYDSASERPSPMVLHFCREAADAVTSASMRKACIPVNIDVEEGQGL